MERPAPFDYRLLAHPPSTFRQEKLKTTERLPAARRFIVEHRLNETFRGTRDELGLIVQGGLYNTLIRALQQLGLADEFGASVPSLLVLNVTYPLAPEEIRDFCAGKRAVLVVEEGQPEFIEQEIATLLRRQDVDTPIHGKDLLAMAGEYTVEVIAHGLAAFFGKHAPDQALGSGPAWLAALASRRAAVAQELGEPLPARPPQFCIGCPERPVFAALKLLQQDIGRLHIAADIGCHSFATFEPFNSGHTILGYGMSLASRAGVSPMMKQRALAIMGDGGFWHNGLVSGVQSALFNGDDAVLIILKNGYTSATGTQEIFSTPDETSKAGAADKQASLRPHQRRDRADARRHRRQVAARRRQLSRRGHALDAGGGVRDGIRRAQGDRRAGRVPARAAAPRQALACGARCRRASARCASSTASTRTPARATTRASGFRAARRSRSRKIRIRCASIRWRPCWTGASAAACAARTRTPLRSVRRSTAAR